LLPHPSQYVILFIMKVSEIGEFSLIDRLQKMIADAGVDQAEGLLIGIGDDCAAWKCSGRNVSGAIQLATVDSMVEGVHFTLDTVTWRELGWKSLAINLSDIAAMGGAVRYILINLALPDDTAVEDIEELYRGMIELTKQAKAAIVGGNISGAPQVSITITVIGESVNGHILKRSAAKTGDAIAVTGWPGSAAGGLAMLMQKLKFAKEDAAYFKNAFLHPIPRLEDGQILVKNGIATAIDTSDGLISDLRHICEASKVSARINVPDLPVHELLKKSFKDKAIEMALSGGEDYNLLFTGNADVINKIKKQLEVPVHIIGEITGGEPGKIDLLDNAGKPVNLKKTGWTHF
jgi:thiamine-monophosphate kinase